MAVELKTDNDFENALADNKLVIVKYFADWCGSCRLFTPKFKRLSEDERYKDITFLDVNAEKSPEARKKAGVDNLPFFGTFKNGELIEGTATTKEEKLVEMLDNLKN
ncbi:MAG: thioredoxin [Chitinophagaceae bacterium]|nr:MAG: thioredoxin [Chitinophagaceae bacterium]